MRGSVARFVCVRMHGGDFAPRCGGLGVPTILFLDPKGHEIEEARVTGFIPAKNLLMILRSPEFQKNMTSGEGEPRAA